MASPLQTFTVGFSMGQFVETIAHGKIEEKKAKKKDPV